MERFENDDFKIDRFENSTAVCSPAFSASSGKLTKSTAFESDDNCGSCSDNTTSSHLDCWQHPGESIIIFDWDDTLCPTEYIFGHAGLRWDEPAPCLRNDASTESGIAGCEQSLMRASLAQHANTVRAVLHLATTLGKVVIITLAKQGWVDMSIEHFMPSLRGLLDDLGIQVIYARGSLPQRIMRVAQHEEINLGKLLKQKAMQKTITRFYMSGSKPRSWKNVLSIGDNTAERWAIQDVMFEHVQVDRYGISKEERCKVLKLVDSPLLEQLTSELLVVISWIRSIMQHEGDLDLDLNKLTDATDLPWR